MKFIQFYFMAFVAIVTISCQKDSLTSDDEKGLYTYDERVEALVKKMSIEEKVGQMTQINFHLLLPPDLLAQGENANTVKLDRDSATAMLKKYYVGSFLNGFAFPARDWYNFIKELQTLNAEIQPNQIPILFGMDHVHGTNYLKEGTVFPHNLNVAATFNPAFAKSIGEITAMEAAPVGHTWNFAPILDIGRNKMWPRLYETFGEDPYLISQMGASFIKGVQGYEGVAPYKMIACAKHFLGYSDPRNGFDRAPSEISPQALREFFLPSFQAAVDAGVKTFMINSGEVNGIPVHANYEILTKLLRKEMGFQGLVVTDWEDIKRLHNAHRVAETEKEAVYMAIMAGIDMSMVPYKTDFCDYLLELVKEGRIPTERIDLSVKRILKAKFDAGLFENPYPTDKFLSNVGKPENKAKNLEIARESIVLMKNDKNVLPISAGKKVVVAGPAAHSKMHITGGWSYRWLPRSDKFHPATMPTLYEAMSAEFGENKVDLANEKNLKAKAAAADVIVLALGEEPYSEGFGSIIDLDLSKEQINLAEIAISTSKPIVLVLLEGRPRTIPTIYDRIPAVIFAGLPGTEGGTAIAEILSGKTNPSAKMAITYPYKQGHILPYNHKHLEFSPMHRLKGETLRWNLAQFGEGLSYTTFEYSDITLSSDTISSNNENITATVTVKNTGSRAGKEAVLWFITDEIGSYTRPVRALKSFDKKEIQAGDSSVFTFEIQANRDLTFPNAEGGQLLEYGDFTLSVGDKKAKFRYVPSAK
jgi:beta-glucosidase